MIEMPENAIISFDGDVEWIACWHDNNGRRFSVSVWTDDEQGYYSEHYKGKTTYTEDVSKEETERLLKEMKQRGHCSDLT
jgi:hypothetical protein